MKLTGYGILHGHYVVYSTLSVWFASYGISWCHTHMVMVFIISQSDQSIMPWIWSRPGPKSKQGITLNLKSNSHQQNLSCLSDLQFGENPYWNLFFFTGQQERKLVRVGKRSTLVFAVIIQILIFGKNDYGTWWGEHGELKHKWEAHNYI